MEVEIRKPIKIPTAGGKFVETNILRFPDELKAKHIQYFPKAFVNGGTEADPKEIVPFVAGVLELPLSIVEEMDLADLLKVMGRLPDFLIGIGFTS